MPPGNYWKTGSDWTQEIPRLPPIKESGYKDCQTAPIQPRHLHRGSEFLPAWPLLPWNPGSAPNRSWAAAGCTAKNVIVQLPGWKFPVGLKLPIREVYSGIEQIPQKKNPCLGVSAKKVVLRINGVNLEIWAAGDICLTQKIEGEFFAQGIIWNS